MRDREPGAAVHFACLEGLRAYLAIWVALGHGLILAGYQTLPAPLNVLLRGDVAVYLFMVLSGFVITHLITTKQESYGIYLFRRFLRLFPAYAICSIIGYMLIGMWADVTMRVPWQELPNWPEYVQSVKELAEQSYTNTAPHAALHVLMLHGVVPNEILPRAPMTFLPAAWSVSLEWQFYLFAPLILFALRNKYWAPAIVALFVGLKILSNSGTFGTFNVRSFLGETFAYFAVGIATRLAFPHLKKIKADPTLIAGLSIIFVMAFSADQLTLFIWACFVSVWIWAPDGSWSGNIFNAMFASRPSRFLGKISYSIYLLHRPVQVLAAHAVLNAVPLDRPLALTVQWVAVIVTIPFAALLYRYVEAPCMEFGRNFATGANRRPPPATSDTAPGTT